MAEPAVENAIFATISASQHVLRSSPFFRAFVCSFLSNVVSARLFLFAHPADTAALLREHLAIHPRITVVHLGQGTTGCSDDSSTKLCKVDLQTSRYSSYQAQLQRLLAHGTSPAHVALVDASDVVFQADPFSRMRRAEANGAPTMPPTVYFTEESRDYTLGQQASNALWVRELFGDAMLQRHEASPVLCSGFTMGHVQPILGYLAAMVDEGTRLRASGKVDAMRQRHGHDRSRGFDQGIHNVLAREGWLGSGGGGQSSNGSGVSGAVAAASLKLLDGPVLHGNGARAGRHFVYSRGVLHQLRLERGRGRLHEEAAHGEAFAVVHQYGKMRPKYLQAKLRFRLTCRHVGSSDGVPRHCCSRAGEEGGGGTGGAGGAAVSNPRTVREAICSQLCGVDTPWLGVGRAVWNRTDA